jgi:hypothetical protein
VKAAFDMANFDIDSTVGSMNLSLLDAALLGPMSSMARASPLMTPWHHSDRVESGE